MNEPLVVEQPAGARKGFAALLAFMLLTLATIVVLNHFAMIWIDEFLVLQTDDVASLAQVFHIQRFLPISLDPFLYHAVVHFSIRAFGQSALGLRAPAMVGFLLMELCVYGFVRRIASPGAAVLAAVLPAALPALIYGFQGRPYGLVLGCTAALMLSWQTAVRRRENRLLPLVLLSLTLAALLNMHYFCVLLLIPVWGAELYRTLQNRKLDGPMWLSILAGTAGIAFILPFQGGAKRFRLNYHGGGEVSNSFVSLWDVPHAYRTSVFDASPFSPLKQKAVLLVTVVVFVLLAWSCVRELKRRSVNLPSAEVVFLALLSLLPVWGFLLARFMTHTFRDRYVLGELLGLCVFAAIGLGPLFRRRHGTALVLGCLALAIVGNGLLNFHLERIHRKRVVQGLQFSPEILASVMATPTQRIYVQDTSLFDIASYYEKDPAVRSRLTLVYSSDEEIRWCRQDTLSLTAEHMRHFTGFSIVPYEQVRTEAGPHVFVVNHDGGEWNWTDPAFAHDATQQTDLGSAMGHDVVSVEFGRSAAATQAP